MRLNGPYINWLAAIVAGAVIGTAACHLILKPLAQYWWPVVAKGVGL